MSFLPNTPKVCLLAPLPPPAGGIAVWTKRMTQTTLKNGWGVVVIDEQVMCGRTNFGKKSKPNLLIEIIRCFKIWKNLACALRNKDIVIVQSCICASIGAILRESINCLITHFFRRKFIVHFRCTVPYMVKKKSHQALFRFFIRRADYVMLLNNQSADFVSSVVPPGKYCIIPNFVDESELKKKKQYNKEIKKALYAGGVIAEKGCSLIVDVAKEMPEIEFHLIGKIGIDSQGAPQNVIFHGEQTKEYVEKAMQDADVFLFLTHFWGEGFSNSLAEAMASSLPCIVTDWSANKDMIEGKGGIVVSPDCKSVKDALNRMQDQSIRGLMGEWNYSKVLRDYSVRNVTGKYVDVYEYVAMH